MPTREPKWTIDTNSPALRLAARDATRNYIVHDPSRVRCYLRWDDRWIAVRLYHDSYLSEPQADVVVDINAQLWTSRELRKALRRLIPVFESIRGYRPHKIRDAATSDVRLTEINKTMYSVKAYLDGDPTTPTPLPMFACRPQ